VVDWQDKVGADLLRLMTNKPRSRISVIVQYEAGKGIPRTMRAMKIKSSLPLVSAILADLTSNEITFLAKQKDIRFISSNRPVSTCLNIARPTVGAAAAQAQGLSGQGVAVAVIDSGIYPHPDVNGAIDAFVDFADGTTTPNDLLGHGTHVSGIVLGRGVENAEYTGIAPKSRLISLKVFGSDNYTTLGLILQAMSWVYDNAERYNIRVVNMSLGAQAIEPFEFDPICQAARALWKKNIVVVASVGNEGTQGAGSVRTPGSCPYCLTVGATNDRRTLPRADDILAQFSSLGPTLDGFVKPDCIAPGVDVISLRAPGSTLDRQLQQNRVGQYYFRLSGTSMAAPMVAGIAALILQRRPDLKPDDIKSIVTSTAEDKGLDSSQQGMGYVNTLSVMRYLPSLQTSWIGNRLRISFI